ncbi:COX15/CtaA family protein [Telmatospirillum siberiense]|uniref:Heme A synthase n=1 Tax=Telmatospirillum siberiense TaxID=382514 RepID=A0A2N3PVT2_9PROT|nr:COX15/CtaA family protein [Telmatospirillum siberiense]PKU24526.1 heme A synthase [Telmatospirillum siberiense]
MLPSHLPSLILSNGGLRDDRRPVGAWLLVLAVMVLVMVCLGGLTRLTGSGLSMVEWQPFTVLPPASEEAWNVVFAKYQASPQYRLVNEGMTLAGFKGIFWLEYVHRLWGRLIGAAFLLPFLFFLSTGRLSRAQAPQLLLLFLLGGAQGLLGWFMVASGLADRPEVSHYRLTAHLLAALAIYAALLWTALAHLDPHSRRDGGRDAGRLRRPLSVLLVLVTLTMAAGGLVAGLRAGLIYNSFPLMNGDWFPGEAFDMTPRWVNFFENHALVQFDHRLLAMLTWAAAVASWLRSRRLEIDRALRRRLLLVPLAATLQAGLGISTLLAMVPVGLAAAHQACAFLLVSAILWAAHGVRRVGAPS